MPNPTRSTVSNPTHPTNSKLDRVDSCWFVNVSCRLIAGVIASESLSAFTTPPDCSRNTAGLQQTHLKEEDVPVVDEEHHCGIVWAGVTPEVVSGSIMDALCSHGDNPMASTSWWEWNHERAPQTNPPARLSPSTPPVHRRESGTGGIHGTDLFSNAVEGCGADVFSGVVAQFPDIGFTSPELREVDGATQETVDDAIAVKDWLDATHAMLDAIGDGSPGI